MKTITLNNKHLNNLDDKISFGKYKNRTIEDILNIDPQYITWLDKNVKTVIISKDIKHEAFKKQTDKEMKKYVLNIKSKTSKNRSRQYEDFERTDYDSDFGMAFDF
jgi:hypothetical protein